MKKVLRCGTLFSAQDKTVKKDMAVVVDGEKIAEVMPWASFTGTDVEVIDLSDKFVTPGLIDMHAHVVMDGQVDPFNEMLHARREHHRGHFPRAARPARGLHDHPRLRRLPHGRRARHPRRHPRRQDRRPAHGRQRPVPRDDSCGEPL